MFSLRRFSRGVVSRFFCCGRYTHIPHANNNFTKGGGARHEALIFARTMNVI
jgi:hypothetical protein